MEAKDMSEGYAAWSRIVLVILLTAGAVWLQLPIQSERPVPTGSGIRSGMLQNVDARLWQDPFEVVQKALPKGDARPDCLTVRQVDGARRLEARPCTGASEEETGLGWLGMLVAQRRALGEVNVLAAMVSGGTWVPADEGRRRGRYAVLAGLNAQGYVPVDSEHIGYAVEENVLGVRVVMPYEWLVSKHGEDRGYVLLLWLDDEALAQESFQFPGVADACPPSQLAAYKERPPGVVSACPMSRLTRVLDKLKQRSSDGGDALHPLRFNIIGPSSSSFLVAASREPGLAQAVATLGSLDARWYSPFATLPDDQLVVHQDTGLLLKDALPNFHRVIASDDRLADALAGELALRRFGSGRQIALVGQWDTAYSRTLRALIRERLNEKLKGREDIKIIEASYLRGLDARLPGKPASEGKDDKKSGAVERPEGEAQIDYLRRLAGELASRELEGGRIGAIGVLGNDYYDKLLVLQALRPTFPDAVFFTTDLDAAMLHDTDNRYTRNLVVASGYGLSLNPALQGDIPPFRDGYQTASFLATRLALYNSDPMVAFPNQPSQWSNWLRHQIFEIGRSEAVNLTPLPDDARCGSIADCTYPHRGPKRAPLAEGKSLLWIPLGILIAWTVGVASGLTRRRHWPYWFGVVGFVAAVCYSLLKHGYLAGSGGGEPLTWLQGVSIWPSELLRILAFLASLLLIARGHRRLRRTRERVDRDYFGRAVPARTGESFPSRCRLAWQRLLESLSPSVWMAGVRKHAVAVIRACVHPFAASRASVGEPVPEAIWDTYNRRRHDRLTPLFLRLPYVLNGALFILSYGLLWLLLQRGLDFPVPQTPARGELAFWWDKLLIVAGVLAFESLLFYAMYQGFRAVWLSHALLGETRWPAVLAARYWPWSVGEAAESRYFDAWHDTRFIAAVSEPVQRIIFYPFLVLVLLIAARSNLFDRWHIPAILWVVFATSILLVVVAALKLRFCAERVRTRSLRTLEEHIMAVRADGKRELAEQLDTMRTQIRELKEGAFAPLSQQPLVKAVLTVASGVSGIALLEYVSLANL